MKVISAAQVRQLLPMKECVELMANAMKAASSGDVRVPPRMMMRSADGKNVFALMPGASADPCTFGAKILSIHASNPTRGLPAIQGFVVLFDHDSGAPIAIIEGAEVTGIRTAAASGMATKFLARADAKSHGIFGTGVQARTHIDAIAVARPVKKTVIWGRDPEKAAKVAAEESARTGMDIVATEDPKEAAACDIVSTVTASADPILFNNWVQPGCHVNLVGSHSPNMREADSDLVIRAAIYTDLLESLFNEGGDILIPIDEGRLEKGKVVGEIGNVVAGTLQGRRNDDEVTLYKSLGVTAQDLFAAYSVYEKALASGIGVDVDLA